MQGRHCQRDSVDILLSTLDNCERGHSDTELVVLILATVHDECAQWHPVGRLWQGGLLSAWLDVPCCLMLVVQTCYLWHHVMPYQVELHH